MSSNIRLNKICQHCGNTFTAKTTVTKYCGDDCAKKAYKKRKRQEKITQSIANPEPALNPVYNSDFFTILDIMNYFNISKSSAQRLIKRNNLPKKKIGRWVYIKRSDLQELFQPSEEKGLLSIREASELLQVSLRTMERYLADKKIKSTKSGKNRLIYKDSVYSYLKKNPLSTEMYFSVGSIQEIFNISEKALYDVIKRNNILKFPSGKNVLVLKHELQKILKT